MCLKHTYKCWIWKGVLISVLQCRYKTNICIQYNNPLSKHTKNGNIRLNEKQRRAALSDQYQNQIGNIVETVAQSITQHTCT